MLRLDRFGLSDGSEKVSLLYIITGYPGYAYICELFITGSCQKTNRRVLSSKMINSKSGGQVEREKNVSF